MPPDVGDAIGTALGRIAREATQAVSQNGHRTHLGRKGSGDGALSGMRGVVAGATLAAAAPVAAKGAKKVVQGAVARRIGSPKRAGGLVAKATESVKGTVTDAVEKKVDEAGGAPGMLKEAGKQMLPGGGGGGRGAKGTPGVGKGRRMPVQQAVDIGVPLEVAYNQWTQFEEWPQFMHRLVQATQEDDCTVSFKVKVWGFSRQFVAEIVEQRPDERIQWNVTEGITHTGVVSFHELAPRLTRVQVTLDVEPGSLLEKAARGMRNVKRAVRADLARFKAFVEMQEVETGAWRGTIHDGEVAEQHPRGYDRGRDYADVDDIHERDRSHEPRAAASANDRRSGSRARSAPRARGAARPQSRRRSDGQHAQQGGSAGRSRRRSGATRSRG